MQFIFSEKYNDKIFLLFALIVIKLRFYIYNLQDSESYEFHYKFMKPLVFSLMLKISKVSIIATAVV